MKLLTFDKLVLEHLPFGDTGGLSVAELADGLLHKNDVPERQRVREALRKIESMFILLSVRTRDSLTHYSCNLYTLASQERERVVATLAAELEVE
jgi:hypothetical protein